MKHKFSNFSEFYPYYLSQHSNNICRRFHFLGVISSLLTFVALTLTFKWAYIPLVPFIGYVFGWTGHFFFEKNKPASFDYPFYSFWGDIMMAKDIILGELNL